MDPLRSILRAIKDCDHTYSQALTRIFAGAIKDGTMEELEKYLPDRVYFFGYRISAECGNQNVDYELIPKKYQDTDGYCSGLVASDNDELFLRYANTVTNFYSPLEQAGQLGSRKIMTGYGIQKQRVKFYVSGALVGECKQSNSEMQSE